MKKLTKELKDKTISELEREIVKEREEIARMQLEKNVHPQKDVNMLFKKSKKLAATLTILTEKKEAEKFGLKVKNKKL